MRCGFKASSRDPYTKIRGHSEDPTRYAPGMDLGRWWTDHWDFALGAVIALVIALAIAYSQRKPKILDYRVAATVAILNPKASQIQSKLSVNYRAIPMTNPHLTVVRIKNTGKVGVRRDDYVDPIEVTFKKGHAVDAFVSDQSAPDLVSANEVWELRPDPDNDDLDVAYIASRPKLLNQGEWYEIQILSEGRLEGIKATSRFADQSRPMRDIEVTNRRLGRVMTFAPMVLGLSGGIAVAAFGGNDLGASAATASVFIGGSLIVLGFLDRVRSRL